MIFCFLQWVISLIYLQISWNNFSIMFKNMFFHCVGILLHYFHLLLIFRDVFWKHNKVFTVILVYICLKTSCIWYGLAFEYHFYTISISRNFSRLHEVSGSSVFSNLPWGDKTVEKPYSALSGHRSTIWPNYLSLRLQNNYSWKLKSYSQVWDNFWQLKVL